LLEKRILKATRSGDLHEDAQTRVDIRAEKTA
jgi:hypothetical protein